MSDNNEILLNETELPGLTVQAGENTYAGLPDKPRINNIEISGNKLGSDYNLVSIDDLNNTGSTALQTILGTVMNLIYPVGSILISLRDGNPNTWDGKDSNNQPIQGPWSGTTWEQIPGRFLVGVGANGNNAQAADYLNFTTMGTGGYAKSILPAHEHQTNLTKTTTMRTDPGGESRHSHGTPSPHTYFMTRTNNITIGAEYGRRKVKIDSDSKYYAQTAGASELASTTKTNSTDIFPHTHEYTIPPVHVLPTGVSNPNNSNLPPYMTVYMWKRTS